MLIFKDFDLSKDLGVKSSQKTECFDIGYIKKYFLINVKNVKC